MGCHASLGRLCAANKKCVSACHSLTAPRPSARRGAHSAGPWSGAERGARSRRPPLCQRRAWSAAPPPPVSGGGNNARSRPRTKGGHGEPGAARGRGRAEGGGGKVRRRPPAAAAFVCGGRRDGAGQRRNDGGGGGAPGAAPSRSPIPRRDGHPPPLSGGTWPRCPREAGPGPAAPERAVRGDPFGGGGEGGIQRSGARGRGLRGSAAQSGIPHHPISRGQRSCSAERVSG